MIKIQIDSRLVTPGDTFVAIKGAHIDGHKFINTAIENGATRVVVSNNEKYDVETINVDNTAEYLKNYLIENYSQEFKDMKIIAITGTNGKTTTAYMTYELLRKLNVNVAYIGTIGFYCNGDFERTLNTTPDILNLYKDLLKAKDKNCSVVLIEASSIGLDEDRMAGIDFYTTIFTNLTHDHLDYHGNMENYLKAKLKMMDHLVKGGYAITNSDDKYGKYFKSENTITYGFKDADIKCTWHNNSYSSFKYTYKDKEYEIDSPLFGKYNVYNVMASIGIVISLGFNLEDVSKYYPTLETPKGRINIVDYKTNKIIIDYAHTPDGIEQVLSSAVNLTTGKTYVVFGCPGDRDRFKRPMMANVVSKYADYFILTNDDPHWEDEMQIANDAIKGIDTSNYEVILDRKEAIKKAFNMLSENDTLLILGKGHEEAIIIKDKRIPHNDLKYVESLINNE